jgi:parallel beta-helix repeat protein
VPSPLIIRRWTLVAAVAAALCGFGLTPGVGARAATTISVPADFPTIQAAIDAAADGDTIVVSPGTYPEHLNFLGKAITVESAQGPASTIIDGGNTGTVVTFNSGEGSGSVLRGFTVQHGFAQFDGAGIAIASSPTVEDNTITGNVAGTGGAGIAIFGGPGSPLVQGNTITNNRNLDSGAAGGGIEMGGASARIIGNTISGNRATFGGGLSMNSAGTATIENNLIQGNVADIQGGGIWLVNQSDAAIVQNLVTGNQATTGAGMYLSTPLGTRGPFLTSNTLAGNSASGLGSAIYAVGFFGQTEYFDNVAVAASGQTAVFCDLTFSTQQPLFDHDDFFSATGTAISGCTGVIGTNGVISADPLFTSATDFRLQPGSPAIDAGNDGAPNLPGTDLAGNPRIVNVVDIGAYEFQGLTAPGPVQNLAVVRVVGTGAIVSWTAPASDGGSPITSYTVSQSPGGITRTVGPTTTSVTFTGLNRDTTYTFTVFATNAVGSGPSTSVTLSST